MLKVLMLHGPWADSVQSGYGLQLTRTPGHEQSAEIFEPKTNYIQRAFHLFASGRDMTFEFRYLSGILPAYPDRNEDNGQRVWGYGAPNDGEIRKIELSIQHILDTVDREGPFAGIVGFSSGAAMAAIIASLLEKKEFVCNIPWKVN